MVDRVIGSLDRCGVRGVLGIGRQGFREAFFGFGEHDAVLRALGSGDRGDNGCKVKLEVLGVLRFPLRVVPKPLTFCVGLDEGDVFVVATREA